jgi:coenzyme PQQ synthesis protein D (PqqD)
MSAPVELTDDDRPQRAPAMAWQTVAGETILFHVDAGQLLGVNPVAAHVWSLLDGVRTVRQLAGAVVERFEVDDATAFADVRAFLSALLSAGAIALGR